MSLKCFWKNNKYGFLYSCIAFLMGGLMILAKKHANFVKVFPFVCLGVPLVFLMAWGIYEFIGGDK